MCVYILAKYWELLYSRNCITSNNRNSMQKARHTSTNRRSMQIASLQNTADFCFNAEINNL